MQLSICYLLKKIKKFKNFSNKTLKKFVILVKGGKCMLRKFNKLFLVLGVILFIFVCPGCTISRNVNATYIETSFKDDTLEGQFDFVDNHSDLALLLKNDMPEKYNESFFDESSLLIFKIFESSQGNKSEITSYKIKNRTITINVKTTEFGEILLVGHWWFILELKKEEVKKIDIVKIIKNDEKIMNVKRVYMYLINVFTNHTGYKASTNKIKHYFGMYGDVHAVVFESDIKFIIYPNMPGDLVGGYLFVYLPQIVRIIKDDSCYDLLEAYLMGIINKQQVGELYNDFIKII